jgi:hypothetical protein
MGDGHDDLPSAEGFMPEKIAASSEAHMHAVPEAESQLKLKMAAYFAGRRRPGACAGSGYAGRARGRRWTPFRMARIGGISPGEDEEDQQP